MSEIELVIKISEEMYESIHNGMRYTDDIRYIMDLIENGTPLTESDDCVSRQAVMDLIDKRYVDKIPYERKEENVVYRGYETCYLINYSKLKLLPSVQPKSIIINGDMSANNTKEMLLQREIRNDN